MKERMSSLKPDFVPMPSPEIMQFISIVLFIVGIGLLVIGSFLLYFKKKKERKTAVAWVIIAIGIALIVNHGMQLLF